MFRIAVLSFFVIPVLSACGSSAEEGEMPPVTQEEAKALEDAASMLDEQRMQEKQPSEEETQAEGESQ
jgi:hypothetical protein